VRLFPPFPGASEGAFAPSVHEACAADSDTVAEAFEVERVVSLCMQAGRLLLQFGAETSRVEETVSHMAMGAGAAPDQIQSFVTPTGIFVCMTTADGTQTQLVRVKGPFSLDLEKVTQINALSRQFSERTCTITEAAAALTEIAKAPPLYSRGVRRLCAAVSSGSFTVVLGAAWEGFFIAAVCGLVAQWVTEWLSRSVPRFFGVLVAGLCSAFLASTAIAAAHLGAAGQGPIIIGGILPLLPGLAVTNSIRDLLAGDLLSGVARGAEALFTASAIAVAVAVALSLRLPVR